MNEQTMFDRMNYGRFFHATRLSHEDKVAATGLRIWPVVMDLNRACPDLVVVCMAANGLTAVMGDVTTGNACLMVTNTTTENRKGDRVEAVSITTPSRAINEKGERNTVVSVRPSWAIKKVAPHIKTIIEEMNNSTLTMLKSAAGMALDNIDSSLGRPTNSLTMHTTAEVIRAMTQVVKGKQSLTEIPPYILSRIDDLETKAEQSWENIKEYRERAEANVFGPKYVMGYYSMGADMRGKDTFFVAEATLARGADKHDTLVNMGSLQWFRGYADLQERAPELYSEIMPRLIMFKQARDAEYPNRYSLAYGAYNGPMDREGFFYRNDYFVEAVGAMSYYRSANAIYPQILLLDKGV